MSLATASLALRNDVRITAPTRASVLQAARALGYQPDPAVSAFMLGLRRGVAPAARANLALLPLAADVPPGIRPYLNAVRAGALEHARERGYSVMDVSLKEHGSRLGKMLRARGVSGVIVLPLSEPQDLSDALDWENFSVVGTSFTLLRPRVHLVVPHHLANMQRILHGLHARGYRRVGLLLSGRGFVERVNRTFVAAMALHNQQAGPAAVAPLLIDGEHAIPAALPAWLAEQRPDVIITNNAPAVGRRLHALNWRVPGEVGLFSLGATPEDSLASLDQLPRTIGEEAAFRVLSMMHRGERGVPPRAFVSMVEGDWRDGASLRPSSALIV